MPGFLSRREMLAALASSATLLRAADGISVGMIPDAGATQVSIEQKAPLRDYLAKALGEPVKLIIPTNYNATVEALGNGSLDFAYLGALTYLKAHERYGVVPLVQRSIDKQFHSVFVTQAGSSVKSLADTKGKSFAFGDINSTSGHLIPYRELKKAGVDADRDLKFRYTGSHPATLKAVETGASDAGALDETVYKTMTGDGTANASKVRVFHTSEPFVDYVWVARKEVNPAHRDKFANAFLSLKAGHNDDILEILRGKEFVRVNDSEYDSVRNVARELKML
ncbi:MAG TPA: phosphate/phosphite/phosphonate ABC transporter substrate-binding protein [Bryobacteraceae bacterium]|nr:phosphate/phosphite/phosphonate ABC transporter substrate-binding protein [Bryobacteraceae bacterium]